MSNTYCPLPWVGINILPTGVQPCCEWHGIGEDTNSIKEAINGPLFESTRKAMLEGKKIPNCKQCYDAESVGAVSKRQQSINSYGVVTKLKTQVVSVSFDNLCNLKCRGCCSANSHLWHNDEVEIYGQAFFDSKYLDHQIDIDISKLNYLDITGGEPFLSKNFEIFANKIMSNNHAGHICLNIDTNGTTIPTGNVYELLLNCKELRINISIDGIGHLNDYFRSGSNFDECLKTVDFFKNLKKIRKDNFTGLIIHTTVSVYNVNLLKEIEDFFTKNYPEYTHTHRMLYWPDQLCIKNLPKDYKEKLISIVSTFGNKYADVLNELKSEGENLFDYFLDFHNTLDRVRNENLNNSNLLLSEYLRNYKSTGINTRVYYLKQMEKIKCAT